MINANLGASTWDVLHIGLSITSGLSVGTAVVMVGILLIGCRYALDRKIPKIGTFLNAVLVGVFFDWIQRMELIPSFDSLWERGFFYILGIILMGFGSGMYVATKIGEGPRDGLTITIAERLSLSIRGVRTALEAIAAIVGYILGGPLLLGTCISIFLIGPVFQTSLNIMKKVFTRLEGKMQKEDSALELM
jgi:hypothetical protein